MPIRFTDSDLRLGVREDVVELLKDKQKQERRTLFKEVLKRALLVGCFGGGSFLLYSSLSDHAQISTITIPLIEYRSKILGEDPVPPIMQYLGALPQSRKR